MNTKKGFSLPVIIGLFVLLSVITGVWYFNARPEAEKMMDIGEDMVYDGEAMMEEGEKMMEEGEAMMDQGESMSGSDGEAMMVATAGSYEEYAPEKVANSKGDTLIFFHAKWCPTCRSLDSDITTNVGQIPADLVILKADYDKENTLRQKYGVTTQHTLVQVDADGNLIAKWTGSPNLSSVVSQIQ